MSSPSGVRGRASAENGFWCILKATECSFLYLYDRNLRGKFALASPTPNSRGTCPPRPTVIYAHVSDIRLELELSDVTGTSVFIIYCWLHLLSTKVILAFDYSHSSVFIAAVRSQFFTHINFTDNIALLAELLVSSVISPRNYEYKAWPFGLKSNSDKTKIQSPESLIYDESFAYLGIHFDASDEIKNQ